MVDFAADAAGADIALDFFADHGVALDEVNCLLPADTDATEAARLSEGPQAAGLSPDAEIERLNLYRSVIDGN